MGNKVVLIFCVSLCFSSVAFSKPGKDCISSLREKMAKGGNPVVSYTTGGRTLSFKLHRNFFSIQFSEHAEEKKKQTVYFLGQIEGSNGPNWIALNVHPDNEGVLNVLDKRIQDGTIQFFAPAISTGKNGGSLFLGNEVTLITSRLTAKQMAEIEAEYDLSYMRRNPFDDEEYIFKFNGVNGLDLFEIADKISSKYKVEQIIFQTFQQYRRG